ncbi:hypothetical protein ACFPOD_08725 [Nitratireductor kimnyeongensis]|uniref:Uncharacterized protein n=1 Tax=Nitratireductor kimnyeongensis TaxID=430679 RepID=A0ABW0T9D8_9HYPH|nr:hypothetical protein [Nitratireductor kimnyeongensis]QZZ36322.1 hypothetical protein KW403_04035 [Nitratireductor kimnyeongensis]
MADGYGRAVTGSGMGAMRLGFGVATFALVLGSVVYGEVVHGYGLLRKGDPDFTPFGRVRIGFSFLAALFLFFALKPAMSAVVLARGERTQAFWAMAAAGTFLLAVAAAVHFVPTALNGFVREMQPLGMATEVLLIAAVVGFLIAAWRARGMRGTRLLGIFPPLLVLAGMAGVVFLILMEEMSWGQHWLGWATPELFSKNVQNETNIHNFYTYQFEAIYYTSAIFCFVVLPWCWPRGADGLFGQVEPYLPPRIFALFGLPVASLMFESWNIVPYQVWFFLGLLICLDIVRQLKSFELRLAATALAAIYVVSKLVFITRGVEMVDGYELSEVREFYISILFLAYGWMLAKRFRQQR